MREIPEQVASWLYNVLQPQYLHKQIAYTHIIRFLQSHLYGEEKFKIRTQVYTFPESGYEALMLNLAGNLSIPGHSTVPIQIWVPHRYPFEDGVPIVYVTPDPSQGAILLPGNHIDGSGRFYHPYLSRWFSECSSYNQDSFGRYNLLELVQVMRQSFSKEFPLHRPSGETGPFSSPVVHGTPTPPPKPTKVLAESPKMQSPPPPKPAKVFAESSKMQSTPPDVPIGNPKYSVPLKYQGPLPLPHEQPLLQPPITQIPKETISTSKSTQAVNRRAMKAPDLIDSEGLKEGDIFTGEENEGFSRDLKEVLSKELEAGHANNLATEIHDNSKKIEALHSQLGHHRQQAVANCRNLSSHKDYLSQKVNQISNSNAELVALDKLNAGSSDKVYLNPSKAISIENIVIPDSQLVSQLYDTVAEIKATKDALNMLCGNYKSTKEIVNDNNLEWCMKYARSLGRDLYWLELTRQEISERAGMD
ncbi:hypothetical protein PGUG_04293 [Meyerozyma guilliermondii ATCC 6260]|uniref:UEV domain-containing protein n=1 Tax=Meyerozyma guilliermondii (strain ATCC 6260 / CBS 566 / DSM 6381 / JCM 1539 / NBRC 10279 / NRRL Y-324) TaxID=294746 RepID=A5DLZ2_PICGU|nr:uncharacterized protein PGUG_04293 [Meyerozyma guilliermondii ATCC 6260]EDK40195.2 hypothetical protein PGUG_04293 [Meyerozyma guilliermondii ATCC 6260]